MKIKVLAILVTFIPLSSFSHASCFDVSALVNEKKPDGSSWDINGGLPDIKACFSDQRGYLCRVKEGERAYCEDALNCNLGVVYLPSGVTEVNLSDVDMKSDDPIGNKDCKVNKECSLGNAVIHFKEVGCR